MAGGDSFGEQGSILGEGANLKKSRQVRKLKREKVTSGNSRKYGLAVGRSMKGVVSQEGGEPVIPRREFA